MRVTIAHNKPQQEVKESVDRSTERLFSGIGSGPLEFSDYHKQWHGNTMSFTLTAKMGFIKTPIKGTIEVGEKDLTVDVDLGLFDKLIPQETVKNRLESGVRGLLT